MPIYNYRCAACGAEFEQLVRSDTRVSCPDCNSGKLDRLMSIPAPPAGAGKPAAVGRLGPPPAGGCCGGGCHSHHH
ncbi:MAG TPA: zinc ribbon domain-containing protein [Gemmatimonadales bacterium]|nr:zinc ribbon domain-containing protein [Gemmatimonadales bacterium]